VLAALLTDARGRQQVFALPFEICEGDQARTTISADAPIADLVPCFRRTTNPPS